MSAVKPGICELVGVAVNSSSLAFSAAEGPLDRVAAVGAAAAEIASGADLQGLTLAAVQQDVYFASADIRDVMLDPGTPDARDVLAAELAPLLWHIDYGRQLELVSRAIPLYARWLRHRRLFAEFTTAEHRALLDRFAARVLDEWISPTCIACGGSGKLERSCSGNWIRPRGSMQRNATFRACTACHGNGRRRPSHGDRARWLQVTNEQYETDRWAQRFNAALTWLPYLVANRLNRPLTAQLERRKKRV